MINVTSVFKGFDLHFIVGWILDNHKADPPEVIQNGRKILSMQTMGLKFIDSLSFLQQSLSSLPKTFEFEELQKGEFTPSIIL